jgi:hypothetical protein
VGYLEENNNFVPNKQNLVILKKILKILMRKSVNEIGGWEVPPLTLG